MGIRHVQNQNKIRQISKIFEMSLKIKKHIDDTAVV